MNHKALSLSKLRGSIAQPYSLWNQIKKDSMKIAETNSPGASNTPLLDTISSPEDIRRLKVKELKELCDELRRDLILRVNEVGGHFASSLGVVELTVALHRVFDTPHDRIVWDVGHQAYIHKMLTGRREALSSVRCYGGISGFPRRCESPYDAFGAAHAGTSISAAIGMAEASYHAHPRQEERRVVAVIGDGAITSGMAFEALNHSGELHRKLIVVLNDNEMSISPNVGALSWALSKAVTGKFSTSARRRFKSLVEKGLIPKTFYRALDKAGEATQGFFSTPAMLFESFGYRYIGPIDGHNVEQVIDALERAKEQDGPVLLHALTVKGKGYEPAEEDPVTYHSVGPFTLIKRENAKTSSRNNSKVLSYTEVFGKTMVELCQRDKRIMGITAAMPDGTGLSQLAEQLPDRFFDVAIAEQHAVTFAAGLTCEGLRPVCAIYSTFLQRAFDQIMHDVCLQNLPVVFAIDRGGIAGSDGPTHHGVFDLAYLRIFPSMTVMAPKDEGELRDMLRTALSIDSGPTALRYPRGDGIGVDISREPVILPVGKAEVMRKARQPASSVLLLALGQTVYPALDAAAALAKDGIDATVVNARFVKPLDAKLICKLAPAHQLTFTIEDHIISGGFGSAVLECLSQAGIQVPLVRLGIDDFFVPHGTQQELRRLCGFDAEGIYTRTLRAMRDMGALPMKREGSRG